MPTAPEMTTDQRANLKEGEPVRCFMDGIDWQEHLKHAGGGTRLFPSVSTLKRKKLCIDPGGCGVVEVEVRLIRWVEEQDLDRDDALAKARGEPLSLPPVAQTNAPPDETQEKT